MSKKATSALASGVYAALATPRRPESTEADTAAYFEYLDKVSGAGVDGLVFFGSTGEFVHFDIDERMRVVGLAAKRSRVPLLVNVSHSTFSGARDLADHAIDSGAQGLLLMPPYFYRYGDADLLQFYRKFVEVVNRRSAIYLYNLPFFTTPISQALTRTLLTSGELAGIKDSSGDWDNFELLRGIRDEVPFQLLAGHERIYARALQSGADGVVSGVAAAIPELPVAMKNAPQSEELAARLEEFLPWIDQFPATIAIKEAAEVRGWLRSTVACPLAPETQERLLNFRQWLENWLPETLSLCARSSSMRS